MITPMITQNIIVMSESASMRTFQRFETRYITNAAHTKPST